MDLPLNQEPAFGFGIQKSDLGDGNADARCPTVLLLDVSGSMDGKPLQELQQGLARYVDDLSSDPLARRRVELAIVTFGGGVQVAHPLATTDQFATPTLFANGDTPMGQAINVGLDVLRDRKLELSRQGIPQYRAWVFLITDGAPTDDGLPAWADAVRRLREGEAGKSFLFFAVGVEGANFTKLRELCGERPPISLNGLQFRSLFQWLSASQKAVSASRPGDTVALPPVTWGSITT